MLLCLTVIVYPVQVQAVDDNFYDSYDSVTGTYRIRELASLSDFANAFPKAAVRFEFSYSDIKSLNIGYFYADSTYDLNGNDIRWLRDNLPNLEMLVISEFESVRLPEVTEIYNYAFNNNIALKYAVLPKVTIFHDWVFKNCSSLTEMELGAAPPSVGWEVFAGCPANRAIYVPESAVNTYKAVNDGNASDMYWYGWQIVANEPITVGTTPTDVTLYQGSDGKIQVSAQGGTGTYQYSKDGGSTWQSSSELAQLTAGSYQVQVKDSMDNFSNVVSVNLSASLARFAGGSGTQDDPYQIATNVQLKYLSQLVNEGAVDSSNNNATYASLSYKLVDNIDLVGYQWTPIGPNSTYYFVGNFDGNGQVISNLNIGTVNSPNGVFGYAGLFGYTHGAAIYDVGLENIAIYSYRSSTDIIGGLAGHVSSTSISDCYVTGVLTAGDDSDYHAVGGLVGNVVNNSKITDSYANVTVSGSGNMTYGGGLAGTTQSGAMIMNNYARGSVSSTSNITYVGGLVGLVTVDSGAFQNCYATGVVTGTNAGGLVGKLESGGIAHGYWASSAASSLCIDP